MNDSSDNDTAPDCTGNDWWIFPTSLALLYLSGLATAVLYYMLDHAKIINKFSQRVTILRYKASSITNMVSIYSKLFMLIVIATNIIYYCLFLYRSSLPVYLCIDHEALAILLLELIIGCFLLMYYFIRLLAAKSFLHHSLSLLSIVDIFTLFQPLLSLIIGYDWLGLRALRFVWLRHLTRLILLLLPFNLSADIARICKIGAQFFGLWLATSGILHLLEASGDPWDQEATRQNLTFWKSTYFTIVTMSTVGYGDVTMVTTCGRIVTIIFIIGGLAVYAVALPSLIDITVSYYKDSKYRRSYEASQFTDTVIVCGHLTSESVKMFLKELLHPDKHDTTTHVVFLHPTTPTPELMLVLKAHYTRVHYIMGSPLSTKDLIRCRIDKATAVIVLADRESTDPLDEDRGNLMRVIAVKNTSPSIRVILQLLRPISKEMISSVCGWDPQQDVLLCLNELKLSILAQSCITPGFCALFSNLLVAVTSKQSHGLQEEDNTESSWRRLYTIGASNEVYSAPLSHYFYGMEIGQFSMFCYDNLGLTLLTIEPLSRLIGNNTVGYFIADTAQDIQQATAATYSALNVNIKDIASLHICKSKILPLLHSTIAPPTTTPTNTSNELISPMVDPVLHHKAPPTTLPPSPPSTLTNHIILCIFADKQSSAIGLSCFFSSIPHSSTVVIVTDEDYMRREWSNVKSSCTVYFVRGNPLEWSCLTTVCIESCKMCILLSAHMNLKTR